MLVLSRKLNEKILLPSIHTSVEVLDIKGDRVRLGIEAPASVTILREELAARQAAEGGPSAAAGQHSRRSAGGRAAALSPAAIAQAAKSLEPVTAESLEAAKALVRRHRHQFRNHLNSATIGIALVQRQLQAGMLAQAEATLSKISSGVHQMSDELELVILPPGAAPAGIEVSAADKIATAAPRKAGPPSALLVEDCHNECELLAGFFRLAGYQVATASDGSDAIDYLHQHERPDVMLLDMMLPRCDGPTTIRRLRDDPAFNDLKIFAMSGYTPDQVGLDCGASGVARWFQKPLNPELLLREMNATRLESVAV